jgi:hypothetical protein
MKFTNYIWKLYIKSDKGKNELLMFDKNNVDELSSKFDFELKEQYENENGKIDFFYPYKEMLKELEKDKISSFLEAQKLYEKLVIEPIKKKSEKKYNLFFEYLGAFSTALYHRFPEYFLPYYFTRDNYSDFLRMCDNFGIILPSNPNKNSQEKRAWFYFEICEILHKFRNEHNITTEDFPAFLYCFGIDCLNQIEEKELPKPSRIYFLGAGAGVAKEQGNWDFQYLDNVNIESKSTWGAGGLKIKKGDLILMYCLSPRKYLHSIWRALEDSFIDPFSYYYYGVKVGFPLKIKHIEFQELRTNSILKNNSTVKANMQGLNGRALTVKEYLELLSIIEKKGQSTNDLPKLPVYERKIEHVENERDVEKQLIEPLLKDLGFKESDWIRQLPIKMGRHIKYYPDYALLANSTKEKAKIVLEAKYSINSNKQLDDAFFQARSYGLRLQSEKIVLADMDFVWLYEKINGDFEQKPKLKFHWNDLTNSDNLYQLKEKLRKK